MISINEKHGGNGHSNGALEKGATGSYARHSIQHEEALRLLLASECAEDHRSVVHGELAAIISHWMQSPSDPPILLDRSFGRKWEYILRNWIALKIKQSSYNVNCNSGKSVQLKIDFTGVPFGPLKKAKFNFIDLFAGIGGFRIALQNLGGKCLFSSEWDDHAKETYFQNYGEWPFGDITKLSRFRLLEKNIDILAGGFPCQPFSRAGVSARESLGKDHGFKCESQGQLFFDILNLANIHLPKMLILENVGNLLRHDGGHTFKVIRDCIEKKLKYKFFYKIYNTNTLVPQNRIRCLIVAFRKTPSSSWEMPEIAGHPLPLRSILEEVPFDSPYTLTERMWEGHIRRSDRNVARGTGFTAYVKDLTKPSTTLVARYYKDGKECLIPQPKHPRGLPRMLTQRECARLQGFPENFQPHMSKNNAYKQFGNAVPVPLVQIVAEHALKEL